MDVICHSCGKQFKKKPSRVCKTNFCSQECYNKYQRQFYLGKGNPNKRYIFDDNMFKTVDNEFKAWLLGWIASDGSIRDDSFTIALHPKDKVILQQIRDNINVDIPIKKIKNRNILSLSVSSKTMSQDIIKCLNIETGSNKHLSLNSVNIVDEYIKHFIRGVFEGDGTVRLKSSPEARITSSSLQFLEFIKSKINAFSSIEQKNNIYNLCFYGCNALDFLDEIYKNATFLMPRKYDKYLDICSWSPILKGSGKSTRVDNIYIAKTDDRAVFPTKNRASDSGYDLTLIDIFKQDGCVTFYETGIRVKPPMGYYFDLVGRSSISKSGYILANSFGVIDRTYTGSIKVPLIKIDKTKPDLEMPSRLVQIILRPIVHAQLVEVEELDETERGIGGFGSSGKF